MDTFFLPIIILLCLHPAGILMPACWVQTNKSISDFPTAFFFCQLYTGCGEMLSLSASCWLCPNLNSLLSVKKTELYFLGDIDCSSSGHWPRPQQLIRKWCKFKLQPLVSCEAVGERQAAERCGQQHRNCRAEDGRVHPWLMLLRKVRKWKSDYFFFPFSKWDQSVALYR